jgi:hypothetical protein
MTSDYLICFCLQVRGDSVGPKYARGSNNSKWACDQEKI